MTRISARGILIDKNKVLMIHRYNKGRQYFTIPGGKQEDSETLEQTVVREFLEETSILVKPLKILDTFNDIEDNKIQHIFLCSYIDGSPKLKPATIEDIKMHADPDDRYYPEWVPIDTVVSSIVHPNVASEFFKKYISSNKLEYSNI